MRIRDLSAAAIAALALVLCATNPSLAQKKKAPTAMVLSYKQCCDRANARFYIHNNMATCFAMSERQQEALYACVHERGLRPVSLGQRGI